MPTFLFKSLLSAGLLLLVLLAMFTMFEIFGRPEKKYDIGRLKRIHKFNGLIYIILFLIITYYCLEFIISTKAEPTPRATFHSIFAITVILLIGLKISFIRIYRQFYGQVKTIGILIALISLGMIATSSGYYLLITKLGIETPVEKIVTVDTLTVKTDPESIRKGKELFESKCYFCHEAYSTERGVGPGHKDIMKNPLLPVSKKPSTPENIAEQIRNPYRDMPSFSYLPDEDVQNIIAFLNTL